MKKLLRSLVVMSALLVSTTVGTLGYFSSSATATNNLIQTGSLQVNVGSTAFGTGNQGYWVNLGSSQVATFPDMTNVAPGVPFHFYVAVANGGTLPFDYRMNFSPDTNGGTCLSGWYDLTDACNPALSAVAVSMTNIHRFPANNCEGDLECLDIYTWLTTNNAYNMLGGLVDVNNPTLPFGHPNSVSNGLYTLLAQNDYSIYRVQLTLSTAAGNEYQNMRFRYDFNVQAKQTNAPSF